MRSRSSCIRVHMASISEIFNPLKFNINKFEEVIKALQWVIIPLDVSVQCNVQCEGINVTIKDKLSNSGKFVLATVRWWLISVLASKLLYIRTTSRDLLKHIRTNVVKVIHPQYYYELSTFNLTTIIHVIRMAFVL